MAVTVEANHQPPVDLHPSASSSLISTLDQNAYTFLQPPPSLHSAALVLAKRFLDPLASSVSQAQDERQATLRRKRKRGNGDDYGGRQPLKVEKLYLEGFNTSQVWEQARVIIDAAKDEVDRDITRLEHADPREFSKEDVKGEGKDQSHIFGAMRFDDEGFEIGSSEDGGESLADHISDNEELDEDQDEDASDVTDISEEDEEGEEAGRRYATGNAESYVEDPNGLNDGFFSIEDFNRQSGFLEHRDARGDPNDGAASDEEDIDWSADPLASGNYQGGSLNQRSNPRGEEKGKRNEEEEADEDDEEGGPTFGDADLNAPMDSDEELEDEDMLDEAGMSLGGIENTNDVYYKDFFAPPPRKASKRGRPSKHTREVMEQEAANRSKPKEPEGDIQRTMDLVRRDIFDDDFSGEGDMSQDDDGQDASGLRSTHERDQAKIAEEIRKLEAENVSKRDWTLSGEANAADRPLNSLLEEDLEFERTGKPVPVITAEISEGIEELIKRRILAREFDEVIRRRPDSLETANSDVRRGRKTELDDNKAQQSLADMYEEEHMRNIDPEGHKDKRDEKLRKEHAEIEALWGDISGKLDALCSWHYRPAPPKPSVNIVADVPTVAMEDARPSGAVGAAGAEMGSNTMLAPQEVYDRSKRQSATSSEVVPKTGAPVAREEMTREEKLRRRRRAKERLRKQLGGVVSKPEDKQTTTGKDKRDVVNTLRKGDVKVIGKRGDVRNVEGQSVESKGQQGSGAFKL